MKLTQKDAKAFIQRLENTLGYLPRNRSQDVTLLLKAMEDKPTLYTWHNLDLAVEMLRRQRKTVHTSRAILLYVEQAVALANAPVVTTPIADLIEAAIAHEQEHRADGFEAWIGKLIRSKGDYRHEVYADWLAARQQVAA